MEQLPDPVSRRDRQQQTREALIAAARAVFSEDGYHGANLERIARDAGYSKGAVYSNFNGKAELFLAVMDANMTQGFSEVRDPFTPDVEPGLRLPEGTPDSTEISTETARGFALATLEFIAFAARHEELAGRLAHQLDALLEEYTAIARRSQPPGETLSAEEVGRLLAAMDQGSGLLLLAGNIPLDEAVYSMGVQRLIDPARAVQEHGKSDG